MKFEDAQTMAAKHPDTFTVHNIEDLRTFVEPGDYVKVCHTDPGERFWVRVDKIDGEVIHGRVANELVFTDLAFNETIKFGYRHIYDYQPKDAAFVYDEEENLQGVHAECN